MKFKYTISENPNFTISVSNDGNNTFNDITYKNIVNTNNKLSLMSLNNIKYLYQYISNPIKINIDKCIKNNFDVNKDDLNKFFEESEQRRKNDEIYKSSLFQILNPYYVINTKKYITANNFSEKIKCQLTKAKKELNEQKVKIDPDKYFDEKKNVCIECEKEDLRKYNEKKIIEESIREHRFLVRIKNNKFKKNLLLKPDCTFEKLNSIICFLYKYILKNDNCSNIQIFHTDKYGATNKIEDFSMTLDQFSKMINAGWKKRELIFYTQDFD